MNIKIAIIVLLCSQTSSSPGAEIKTSSSPGAEIKDQKRKVTLTDIDVERVMPPSIDAIKKFSLLAFCQIKGEVESSGENIANLNVDVTYADSSMSALKLHIILTANINNRVLEFPGAYELNGVSVDPNWTKEELVKKLKDEMICGLFSGFIKTVYAIGYYIIKYHKVKKEEFWCDVYNFDDETSSIVYRENDICTPLEQDYDVMSRYHITVDSPRVSESKHKSGKWSPCSTDVYPERKDEELCAIGDIKIVIKYYCCKGDKGTFGYRLFHIYKGKEVGSYTLPNSESISGTSITPENNSYVCRLFRFKIENDNRIQIQYLSFGSWFVRYCDTFEMQNTFRYKKVTSTTPCNRYLGKDVYYMTIPTRSLQSKPDEKR